MTALREELRLIGCHANGDARCTCGIGQDALALIDAQSVDIAQLRIVLTECVENGDVWAALPQPVRDAAIAQFQRLEASASEAAI